MIARHVDVLVIGAGPTGIGAAVRLAERGVDHLMVEAGASVGGMARSVRDEHGFTWDLGGHVIHSHFASFDKAIAAAGTPMLAVRRNGYVWMGGRLLAAPIQQQLDTLPDDLRPGAPASSLAEYYRNTFGAELTSRFFAPYTAKMWAHDAELIDHRWTSLRSGSGMRNVPTIGLASQRREQPVEFFPYPEGGTGQLWLDIADALLDESRLRLNTAVVALDAQAREATLSDGTIVHYDSCISTAAITTTMGWVGIEAAHAGRLATSAVHAIGFGMTGTASEQLADKTYLHSPDADVPWYRATVLSNYDPGSAGAGRWNVLCEVSTSAQRPTGLEDAVRGSRESLARLGVDTSTITSVWTTLVPMGYPVPTLGRDEILRDVDDRLLALGIRSRGRFGGWRYESCNQDYSYAQGVEAVDALVDGTSEDVYWHPERF